MNLKSIFYFFSIILIPAYLTSTELESSKSFNRINKLMGHLKVDKKYQPLAIETNACAGISQSSIELFQKKLMTERKILVSLSQIIEWNLSGNDLFISNSFNNIENIQNPTRKALALKWVKNASTRIFNDPYRCFLEIVVNALDAMLPEEESVGKFGMGFFSILSFLDLSETDGTTITISTAFRDKSSKLIAYKMTINRDKALNDILIEFELIDPEMLNNSTGSIIEITPQNSSKFFSSETIDNIYKYLHYLGFYKKGVIDLSIERNRKVLKEKIGSPTADKHVTTKVTLTNKKLSTQDTGTGIPLYISITKLLFPSSSTKGKSLSSISEEQKKILSAIEKPKLVNFKGKKPENKNRSHFLIEINGVLVVIITNKENGIEKQIIDKSGNVVDLLISMPQLTQLTLARNEIYVNPNGLSFEETYLKALIESTINNIISCVYESEDKLLENQLLISALYNGFSYWEKQTAAEHLNGYFTNYIKTVLNRLLEARSEILPVHPMYFKTISGICRNVNVRPKQCILLPLDPIIVSFSYSKLEKFLKEYYSNVFTLMKDTIEKNVLISGINQELISGKIIFFVPDDLLRIHGVIKISDLGFRKSLFVPVSLLKEGLAKRGPTAIKEFLSNKIISRYTDTILNSFGVEGRNLPQQVFLWNASGEYAPPSKSDYKLLSDEKLAQEFVKKYFDQIKCLKTNVSDSYSYYGSIITCYDQNCIKSDHYHSKNIKKLGFNLWRPTDIDLPHKFITIDGISDIFANNLNGIKAILNGQRDTAQGINKSSYENYEFPAAICHILRNAVLFIEPSGEAFSFDYDQLRKIFTQEFKTNEHIAKIATFEKKETHYNEKDIKLINKLKPFIVDLIQKNKLLKPKLTSIEIVNLLFKNLLIQNRLLAANEDGSFIIEYCSNTDLWPLKIKNLETIGNLFLSLISNMNYSWEHFKTYVDPILRSRIIVKSSDLSRTLVKSAIIEKAEELPVSLEYQNTLSNNITDLNIPSVLLNSLIAYFKLRDLEQLPIRHKKIYFEFRNSMLNLYKQFFRVADSEISYNYGHGPIASIKALNPINDITCENLVQFLATLKNSLSLYNKLVEFQIIDFAFQTDKNLRAIDLMNKKFYVPSILCNTPLSVLSHMSQGLNIHENIIRTIIEYSRNPAELMYISYLICNVYSRSEKIQVMLRNENKEVENNIKLIIRNFIQEKIDQDRINQIYNENRNRLSCSERIKFVSAEPITEPIVNYLLELYTNTEKTFAIKSSFIPTGIIVTNTKSFTLKQLINAHCSEGGLERHFDSTEKKEILEMLGLTTEINDKQLKELIDKINSCDAQIDIGKIEQSVEAGSEKNPICGSITEALQNSTDAIKSFLIAMQKDAKEIHESCKLRKANNQTIDDLTRIEYSLDIVPSKTASSNTHLCLTMRDYIGFSTFKALMTDFLLPDYSNKKPDLGNVGDMGNGSFKIYQQAEMVSLFTRPIDNPAKVYWLMIVPIRNKLTNRVEDLSITIRNVTGQIPKKLFGTSIKIVFLREDKHKNDLNLIYIKDFLNNNVGATNINLPFDKKIQIFMNANGKRLLLNKPTNMIFENKCRVSSKPKFRVYERSNNFLQSFVTTGGVPFRTLNSLGKQMNLMSISMLQEMSFGYIIDLDVNTYEPVQSRTLLQMKTENIKELRQTLLDTFYIIGLKKGIKNSNFFEKVFTHFGSKITLFSQVEITASENEAFKKALDVFINNRDSAANINLESFFTFYKPTWAQKSFFEYIQGAYKTLVPLIDNAIKLNNKLMSDWHHKNKKDLMVIATSKDSKVIEELKKSLQVELDMVKAKCTKNINEIWNKWKIIFDTKSDNEFTDILEKNVVLKWIDHKITSIIKDFESKEIIIPLIPKKSNEFEKHYNWELYKKDILAMNNLMKHSLMSYARLYFAKLGIKGSDFDSRLTKANFFYNHLSHTAAAYYVKSKLIEVNIKYFSIADYFELLIKVLTNNIAAVRLDRIFNQLFTNTPGTDATITHELEHVRRRDDHNGAHSPAVDVDGNMTNYRGCANSYSKKAQELGLLEDWSIDLNNYLKANKIDLKFLMESMKYTLNRVREMEIENKTQLMKNLGYLGTLRSML